VVASRTSLEQQCKEKKFASVDILIDETPTQNEPYHCIGVILMPHHQVDQKFAPPENQAIVRVHKLQGQTVRWYSDTTDFMIYRIEPQHPKGQQPQEGPANPFMGLSIPTPLSRSITSGQLVEFFAKPKSDRRYKMILRIGKELREIDPDVWCQP
jgi:hypothetical protein